MQRSRTFLIPAAGVVVACIALAVHRSDVKSVRAGIATGQTERAQPSVAPAQRTTPFERVAPELGAASTFAPQHGTRATAGYGGVSEDVPTRVAVDSGRAQPLFIALRTPQAVRVGEPFNVEIAGESENDFARVALSVKFDPASMRVAGVRQGDLMERAGATAALSYGVDVQAGRVSIQLNENDAGNPISGGGTLCAVEFVATVPGRAVLSIADVAVGDLNNEAVAYSVLPARTVIVRE